MTPQRPDWMDEAACVTVDPELWYPEKGNPSKAVKRICGGCPVKNECLQYALDNGERHGIYGGLGERERRPLHRNNRARPTQLRYVRGSFACPDCSRRFDTEHGLGVHARTHEEGDAA